MNMKSNKIKYFIVLGIFAIFAISYNFASAGSVDYTVNPDWGHDSYTSYYPYEDYRGYYSPRNTNPDYNYNYNPNYNNPNYNQNPNSNTYTQLPPVTNNYYYQVDKANTTTNTVVEKAPTATTTAKATATETKVVDDKNNGGISSNGLTALSFRGSGGFMPSSIWQWMIVIALILVIIILARMIGKKGHDAHGAH